MSGIDRLGWREADEEEEEEEVRGRRGGGGRRDDEDDEDDDDEDLLEEDAEGGGGGPFNAGRGGGVDDEEERPVSDDENEAFGEDGWKLSDLKNGLTEALRRGDRAYPDPSTRDALLRKFHGMWVRRRRGDLVPWIRRRFGVELEAVDWQAFEVKIALHHMRLGQIKEFLARDGSYDGERKEMVQDAARVLYGVKGLLVHAGLLRKARSPSDSQAFNSLPGPESGDVNLRDEDAFADETENLLVHDSDKNTNFQNAFLYLRLVLEGEEYRRADGKFFKRVVTRSGYQTLAFREDVTIEKFVAKHTDYVSCFKAWKWVTKPPCNFDDLVKYLTKRPVAEAKCLTEHMHLRSYEGDEVGRGAGVYDDAADFFFPYALRSIWGEMAATATRVRRRWKEEYECLPPDDESVCVVHLDAAFPFDTHEEVTQLERQEFGRVWRVAEEFECRNGRHEVKSPRLVAAVQGAVAEAAGNEEKGEGDGAEEVVVAWQYVVEPDLVPSHFVDLTSRANPKLIRFLEREGNLPVAYLDDRSLAKQQIRRTRRVPPSSFVRVPSGDVYVPVLRPALSVPRVHLPLSVDLFEGGREEGGEEGEEEEDDLPVPRTPRAFVSWKGRFSSGLLWQNVGREPPAGGNEVVCRSLSEALALFPSVDQARLNASGVRHLTPSSFVRADGGDCFCPDPAGGEVEEDVHYCVDTGRTWEECEAKEVDQIYACQRFCKFDRFMLYACKGRLFFEVGERDNFEMTLMKEGVGGCGKSTDMKLQQMFFPPHLRGILSSNMQPQFGMSAVAKAKVIYCNEVSAELNITQEEWQTSTSGEWGSYAVKFDVPLVCRILAQHYWIGNSFPKKFHNEHLQVSRRLAGVVMPYPVTPRDGSVLKRMAAKIGGVHRRQILAYEVFVEVNGNTDPMSQPEKLPPAFAAFYMRGRRESDPMVDFILEGQRVERRQGKCMLMSRLKELYNEYRLEHHMKPVRWTESTYRTAFNDYDVNVMRGFEGTVLGKEYKNVDLVRNLCSVRDEEERENEQNDLQSSGGWGGADYGGGF